MKIIGFLVVLFGGFLISEGIGLLIKHRDLRFLRAARRSGVVRIASTPAPPAPEQADGPAGDFDAARPGAGITVQHPERGAIHGRVIGTIRYQELWQRRKASGEPWVHTGNSFTAHWLGDMLLYAWKGSLWILDAFDLVTDVQIKQTFLPAAQRFGQSDETADTHFAYPPGSWRITDIGKFRVSEAHGTGLRLAAGAEGRFLHAEGDSGLAGQALVIEDYLEGAGGEDTVWRGWKTDWSAIIRVE